MRIAFADRLGSHLFSHALARSFKCPFRIPDSFSAVFRLPTRQWLLDDPIYQAGRLLVKFLAPALIQARAALKLKICSDLLIIIDQYWSCLLLVPHTWQVLWGRQCIGPVQTILLPWISPLGIFGCVDTCFNNSPSFAWGHNWPLMLLRSGVSKMFTFWE